MRTPMIFYLNYPNADAVRHLNRITTSIFAAYRGN